MSFPTPHSRRGFQKRVQQARPGSVLVLVIAILVLMALVGTAYISTAHTDRAASLQNSYNTEIDLLLQGAVEMTKDAMIKDVLDNFWGAGKNNWTSPINSSWLSPRVPVVLQGPNLPGWSSVTAPPAPVTTFESPYANGANTSPYPAATLVASMPGTASNLIPTYLEIKNAGGTTRYPAFLSSNNIMLAADTDGDGIADAFFYRLPLGAINGVTYYAAARIIDNNSAVNGSVAWQPNDNTKYTPMGNFFPTNVNLARFLFDDPASPADPASLGMQPLNVFRWNDTSYDPNTFNSAVTGDTGPRNDFKFASPSDALWQQLGRRLSNPGINTQSSKQYQALSIGESAAMANRFCLVNPATSSSLMEQWFPTALRNSTIRSSAYPPDQAAAWFKDNFDFTRETSSPPTNMPRRALIVARNGISNFEATTLTDKGAWVAGAAKAANVNPAYNLGDYVNYVDANHPKQSFVCLQPTYDQQPDPTTDTLYWAREPWSNHPTKTSINTGTYGQLFVAFWEMMSQVPTGNKAFNDPNFNDDQHGYPTFLRSIVRNPNTSMTSSGPVMAGNISPSGGDDTGPIQAAINNLAPGGVLTFSAGTYQISGTLHFLGGRSYVGSGGSVQSQISLSIPQMAKVRSALAAVNTASLRSGANDVISQTIDLGPPTVGSAVGGGNGGTILAWANASDFLGKLDGDGITITGITFSGSGLFGDTIANAMITNCTFQNNGSQSWPADCAVCYNGLTDSSITHNTFLHWSSTAGIFGYNARRSHLDDNTFEDVREGMHVQWGNQPEPYNSTILRNRFNHTSRFALETQGTVVGLDIGFNWADNFTPADHATMGYSLAVAGDEVSIYSQGVHVHHNYAGATGLVPGPVANGDQSYAFEISGADTIVDHNLANGPWGAAIVDGCTTPAWSYHDNVWAGLQPITGNPVGNEYHGTDPAPGNVYNNQSLPNAVPTPTPDQVNSGAYWNTSSVGGGGAPVLPPPTAPNPNLTISATVYSVVKQPYITEVYATNAAGGYIAMELYNPYDTPINLKNWKLATIARQTGFIGGIGVTPLPITSTLPPSLQPHEYRTLVSPTPTPAQYTSTPPGNTYTVQDLNTAFDNELVLLRPRDHNGVMTLSETSDITQMVPVDSYDFTGLIASTSSTSPTSPVYEWHYVRPNDVNAQKAWHWVHPGPYLVAQNASQPRFTATMVGPLDPAKGLTTFGAADASSAQTTNPPPEFAIQIANKESPSPFPVGASANQFPFGAFARNGDIAQIPFIGAYRIQAVDPTAANPVTMLVELNSLSMDAAYAGDGNPDDDAAEGLGRPVPINPDDTPKPLPAGASLVGDYGSAVASPYHPFLHLFDYLTVFNPQDDYLPNVDPTFYQQQGNPWPQAVANTKSSLVNSPSQPPGVTPSTGAGNNWPNSTEDTAPVEGQININTAPWPVLAALPMSDDPIKNAALAQAIVYYRDVDDGTNPTGTNPPTLNPHGPFKSIWELNGVTVNTVAGTVPSINGGQKISFRKTLGHYDTDAYDPATTDAGNADGDISPLGATDQVLNDVESQNLALTRISNMITTRSDTFTVYVLVQGWRRAGTSQPELVAQRRAVYIGDRTGVTATNKQLVTTNLPVN